MRTIIDLPNPQIDALSALCKREHISRAEAIRRAVQQYLDTQQIDPFKAAFGIWRDRKFDALDYVDALRAEWDR